MSEAASAIELYQHPVETGSAIVDAALDEKDPSKAVGYLMFSVVTVALSVAGIRAAGDAATAASDASDAAKAAYAVSAVSDANDVDEAAITKPYSRPSNATTPAQRAAQQGKPCVSCGLLTNNQVADHIVPLVQEYYSSGRIDLDYMRSLDAVQPQCPACSASQEGSSNLSGTPFFGPLLDFESRSVLGTRN